MKLEVIDGAFSYGDKKILKDISFSIESGEILAVLGQNGIGKTTLLRCTMGLLHWRKGATLIDGKDIKDYKETEVWKRIGYVPQAKNSISSCTALEMVLLGRSTHLGFFQQPGKEDLVEAEKALRFVGMDKIRDSKCNRISGGELQMVLIARALCSHPELLILDEPESNLDFRNQLLVLDTITRLARVNGIAAIVNTHYPVHALKISNKTLILNDDSTSRYGFSSDMISEESLSSAFHVDVRIGENVYDDKRYRSVIPIRII